MPDPIEAVKTSTLPPAGEPAAADPEGIGTEHPDDLAGLKRALASERALRREGERQNRGLQDRLRQLEYSDLRREIAATKGLSPSQAHRLIGTTKEELEADADDLLLAFEPPNPAAGLRTRPTEKLQPGAVPQAEGFDPGAVVDRILRR
jgi:hypothetical protein